jgi:hypothetical protein
MAVAYSASGSDVVAYNSVNGPINETTHTITNNGSNLCIVAMATIWDGFGNLISDDANSVTGVSIGGNAMTFMAYKNQGGSQVYAYYRAGAIGVNKDLVFTYEDGDNIGLVFTSVAGYTIFTGVDQSAPLVESTTAGGLSTNPTVSVTSDSADNAVGDATSVDRGGTAYNLTEDGAGTNRFMTLGGALLSRHFGCMSDVVAVGAQSMSYNISGVTNKNWAMIGYELKAAASGINLRTLVGFGT